MLRLAVLVAVLGLAGDLRAAPATAEPSAVPLPRASRGAGATPAVSGESFRRTVAFYQRWLRHQGTAHQAIPIYQRGDTAVARFLSRDPRSPWLAIHVFRHDGRTRIAVIPRGPRAAASP